MRRLNINISKNFNNFFIALLLSIFLMGIVFFIFRYFSFYSHKFPYTHSGSVQILLDQNNSLFPNYFVYTINYNDVEGEATLTSIPEKIVALSIINSIYISAQSPFKISNAPYGGHISEKIDCPAKKYLKVINSSLNLSKTKVILAVASSRRIIGVCLFDQIKYVSAVLASYDEKLRRLIVIKLFKAVKSYNEIDESQEDLLKVIKNIGLK